jgi:hypothetical protein
MSHLVTLIRERGQIGVTLGLKRRDQHPPGTFPADLVQVHAQLRADVFVGNYSQHWRFLPRRRSSASVRFGQRGRYAAPRLSWSIHKFWL